MVLYPPPKQEICLYCVDDHDIIFPPRMIFVSSTTLYSSRNSDLVGKSFVHSTYPVSLLYRTLGKFGSPLQFSTDMPPSVYCCKGKIRTRLSGYCTKTRVCSRSWHHNHNRITITTPPPDDFRQQDNHQRFCPNIVEHKITQAETGR